MRRSPSVDWQPEVLGEALFASRNTSVAIQLRRSARSEAAIGANMYLSTDVWSVTMSDSNVVPLRRREAAPSMAEIELYRRMTRNWSDEMRQLMFPLIFELDVKSARLEGK